MYASSIEDAWAQQVEEKVRAAFKKHVRIPEHRIDAKTIDENVKSSWLEPGRRSRWIEPQPFHVLVFTESGNLREPYWTPGMKKYYDKVVETLAADPAHRDAGWESVNQAVQYIWVEPKIAPMPERDIEA